MHKPPHMEHGDNNHQNGQKPASTDAPTNTGSELAANLSSDAFTQEFLPKYVREQEIKGLLHQAYAGGVYDNFYDEGDVIFANNARDSKIFDFDGEQLQDIGFKFRKITKLGDFYLGTKVDTYTVGEKKVLKEGSERYTILSKKGLPMLSLRGSVSYRSDKGLYCEYYHQNNQLQMALYDKHFSKIIEGIPADHTFLEQMDDKLLFIKPHRVGDPDDVYILAHYGSTRDGTYMSADQLADEPVYEYYVDKTARNNKQAQEQQEQNEKIPLDFVITFKPGTGFIQNISSAAGELVFEPSDAWNYTLHAPYEVMPSELQYYKQGINTGLFILTATDTSGRYQKNIFINAKAGIRLDFDDTHGVFLDKQVVRHFINGNDAELYNIQGEKLGLSTKHNVNEHDYQTITCTDNKLQIVENSTGVVIPQKFDEILRVYDTADRKVILVQNNGQIHVIPIRKQILTR